MTLLKNYCWVYIPVMVSRDKIFSGETQHKHLLTSDRNPRTGQSSDTENLEHTAQPACSLMGWIVVLVAISSREFGWFLLSGGWCGLQVSFAVCLLGAAFSAFSDEWPKESGEFQRLPEETLSCQPPCLKSFSSRGMEYFNLRRNCYKTDE